MDITMRHVVLRTIDTVDVIIPNSKINSLMIRDTSYKKLRSLRMDFNVAYGTDIEKASEVIKNEVINSELTVPAGKDNEYGPVFFDSFADSSLVLSMIIYFKQSSSALLVKSDINKRVNDAFIREGIEIPFNYVNVVMKNKD